VEPHGGNRLFLSHETPEAMWRSGIGMYLGDDRFHNDRTASDCRSETYAGPHESFSVTFAESLSQTGKPRTDRSDPTATNSTSTHAMRSLCSPPITAFDRTSISLLYLVPFLGWTTPTANGAGSNQRLVHHI
jgi:hypothetical protein